MTDTRGARWFPAAMLNRVMPRVAVEALRRTHSNADTKGVDKSVQVRSDPLGVFSAFDGDLVVPFFEGSVLVATRTVHGVLDTGTGMFTLTSTDSTGETTEVSYYSDDPGANNIGASVRAEVVHVKSGVMATANFIAIDQSADGVSPATLTGEIEFPPGGGGGGMK